MSLLAESRKWVSKQKLARFRKNKNKNKFGNGAARGWILVSNPVSGYAVSFAYPHPGTVKLHLYGGLVRELRNNLLRSDRTLFRIDRVLFHLDRVFHLDEQRRNSSRQASLVSLSQRPGIFMALLGNACRRTARGNVITGEGRKGRGFQGWRFKLTCEGHRSCSLY